jgi:hypothetical protein
VQQRLKRQQRVQMQLLQELREQQQELLFYRKPRELQQPGESPTGAIFS